MQYRDLALFGSVVLDASRSQDEQSARKSITTRLGRDRYYLLYEHYWDTNFYQLDNKLQTICANLIADLCIKFADLGYRLSTKGYSAFPI